MGFVRGIFRFRFWLQLVTLVLLAACAGLALAASPATPSDSGASSSAEAAEQSAPVAAPSEAGGYTRTTVASFRHGSGTADLGLSASPGGRPVGPVSFAVDSGGRIAVADSANGRIQVYGADGKQQRSIATESPLHDLVADDAGSLYALAANGGVSTYDVATGRQGNAWTVRPDQVRSLGQLQVAGSSVSLESPDQHSYPVYANGGSLDLQAQSAGELKGAKGQSGYYYSTSYRDQGHFYRLDAQGKVVLDVKLKLADVASVNFLGEDSSGAVYVVVERLGGKSQVSVEVRRFDRAGALTAIISVPPVTYVEMTRSVVVTSSGDIYELLPTKSGASVLRWRKP